MTYKTFIERKLVDNTSSYGALHIDADLLNPWGIVIAQNSMWTANNHSGTITRYDFNGNKIGASIQVYSAPATPDAPTGLVVNNTTGFNITSGPNTHPSFLITATENGNIYGYNSTVNANAILVVPQPTATTEYKGLTIANGLLFVCNFTNGTVTAVNGKVGEIDVFNQLWAPVNLGPNAFVDPNPAPVVPAGSVGWAPFNIQVIDGYLYVLYAANNGSGDDLAGPANGYINVFKVDGTFVKRLVTGGALNAAWGIVEAPKGFGYNDEALLVGNFGDGNINVYDRHGKYIGKIVDQNGAVMVIPGLWGLVEYSEHARHIFFASGPNAEADGLVGSIKRDGDGDDDC
jgi:uncharacterized protein (TIGR03118 family)